MKGILLFAGFFLCSLYALGQYTPTDTTSYYSEYFKARRKIKISVPSEYAANPNRRYKVIYLFDAQSTVLYDFVKSTLSFLKIYNNSYFDPVILVGVETRNRHFEFLPKHSNTQPKPGNYPAAGGADTLALSLEKELIPFINKNYRTTGFTIGIGHSLGGTFVTYTLLKFPSIFNAAIAVSPNYIYDNNQIITISKEVNTLKNLEHKLLSVSFGKTDDLEENFKPGAREFENILKAARFSNFYYKIHELDNESHGTTPMEGIFKGLIFINNYLSINYDTFKKIRDDKKISYAENIKNYFQQQRKNLGIQPSIGELNNLAYNAFYSNEKEEAIKTLEWAIALYPGDANLFDSIAEITAGTGNIAKARQYYQQGLAIIENQKTLLTKETYLSKTKWFYDKLAEIEKK
jgi:predicted alpha/beta superfamily hydrolase